MPEGRVLHRRDRHPQQENTNRLGRIRNRQMLDLRLTEAIADAIFCGDPLSLLVLEVDQFKSFTEEFRRTQGDEVLRQVDLSLQSCVRRRDSVIHYKEADFWVILPMLAAQEVRIMADRLCTAFQEMAWDPLSITVSVGVSTTQNTLTTGGALAEAAGEAQSQARNEGGNRACFSYPRR